MELDHEIRGRGAATLSRGLPVAHRAHALAMLIVPFAMTLIAIFDAARHGLRVLDVALCATFYAITALGISVGYHRMLSHGAFKAKPWARALLTIFGCMAGEGPPLYWAANHRRHHDFSDEGSDPHSPHIVEGQRLRGVRGFVHAHLGWTISHRLTNTLRYCPDLLRHAWLARVGRAYLLWLALGLLLPALIGGLATRSLDGAFRGLLWGGFVRMFLLYHATLAINSVCHMVGRRAFAVSDQSRNVAWLALPSFGESWHNNHHAFPFSAHFGLLPLQVDLGGWVIERLRALGVFYDVRRPSPATIQAKLQESLGSDDRVARTHEDGIQT
jgi:stearoyl-CoA desaturase (Delta-9 desaturase)